MKETRENRADQTCNWEEGEGLPALSCRVRYVTSAEDPAVCMYRMKGVRDNYVFSQLKAQMLAKNAWYVPACSSTVVRRALSSPFYPVKSVLLTPVLLREMANKIETAIHRRRKLLKAYEALRHGRRTVQEETQEQEVHNSVCRKADSLKHFGEGGCPNLSVDEVDDDEVEVLLVTESLFSEILGMPVNHRQCCAALIDVRMPTVDDFGCVGAPPHELSDSLGEPTASAETGAPLRLTSSSRISRTVGREDSSIPVSSDALFPMLVLDDVQNSDNIGTLMRTAFSLGVRSVLLSPVSYAAVNARSARVSMGSMFHLRLLKCDPILADSALCSLGGGFAWSRHSGLDLSAYHSAPRSPLPMALTKLRRVSPSCVVIGTSPVGDPTILHHPKKWIRNRRQTAGVPGSSTSLQTRQGQLGSDGNRGNSGAVECHSSALHSERIPEATECRDGNCAAGDATATGFKKNVVEEDEEICLAVVVGNEQKGSSREVLDACDGIAAIAQVKGDSLSVSTAAAVVLYTLQQETLIKLREQVPFVPDEDLIPDDSF
ncbi:putative rRNA methylase [Neospora caninum Liverpool]|uniref:Putative rRNA methylase n=1 Tax=Neospora caninum (strain Liverpool) TaxID=572307 RepID=F0VG26_NEOCL|nr:putative rRNA methylase [Neospora caninum Liverpool]CBZ52670.1 putative rRNA methylase [Neospora caninum Liverpool]CEL66647.1 TPA: rRNA methylase, putative [Neospora caninum Liverpool]|eukprot:XP_003882702.1 putative rRNA methylase [Neospora caninum Liverpool]